MVFVDVALIALVLGRLLGGRVGALAETRIRGKALVFAAIGLQLVAFPVDLLPWSTPEALAKGLWLGSYGLLVAMLLLNARLPGLPLIAAGLVSNVVAIVANGGLMPVRGAAMRAAGTDYEVHNNSIQLASPYPCIGPHERVLSTRSSSVPCSRPDSLANTAVSVSVGEKVRRPPSYADLWRN